MAVVSRKVRFIETIIQNAGMFLTCKNTLADCIEIYLDRSYSTSITEEDIAPYEMTKAEFTAIKTFIDNFDLFLAGDISSIAVNNYGAILNKIRGDK